MLVEEEMSDRTIRYRTREGNAVAQLEESLKNSDWSRGVKADVRSSRIAQLKERHVSAKRYAASMLKIAEKAKAQSYAEKLGSLKGAGEVVENIPQIRITWGSAVHQASVNPLTSLRSFLTG